MRLVKQAAVQLDKMGPLKSVQHTRSRSEHHGSSVPKTSRTASGRMNPHNNRQAKQEDDYNARAMLAENSKELDAHTLYYMEGGLAHGSVPIADGAVDKEKVIVAAKSTNLRPTNTAAYQTVVEENDQLTIFSAVEADFDKPLPADLVNRLANTDAHRQQVADRHEKGKHEAQAREVSRWKPPKDGWTKINVDGAFDAKTGEGGVGVIIRDNQGSVLLSAWKYIQMGHDAEEVEALACAEGLLLAGEWYPPRAILEMDFSVMIKALLIDGGSDHA
ncbi:hypothetical protein C2845_PM03G29100 [Panicum miliaceum]|uniref:RNase H type-1 domain-containing protein n=1 Tax=Panicum miliaceum TaxID=4540 RepID=A0A3L6T7H9_PANMI|nr:hypothetical protein C2845_PM03G29100 [Panicum miliaceum]